jgi:phospholipid transport system substrate-binding protein
VAFTVAIAAVGSSASFGAAEDDATAFIEELAEETFGALGDDSLSLQEREKALGRVFDRGFDVPTISRFVLGRHWRAASQAQRKEYVRVFRDFIVKTYTRRFGTFAGERLEVTGVRAEGDGESVVASAIKRDGGPSTRVSWRVRRNSNEYKIVDVMVEGVSMLITHRDEFGSVIRHKGNGVDGLITTLREKTETLE